MQPAVAALLAIPSALYGLAVAVRNRHYDRPGAATQVGIPVISVGNLTMGGTGKTPLVIWLARLLAERGARPAVVSRGYRGKAGRGPLLVSAGDGPLCDWPICGDEPHMLARMLPGVRVVVGSDRVAGATEAQRQGARIVILDDGFQHRRLHRDLDIVLLDGDDPFGGERLLPAGRLREPIEGLARADAVLVTRSEAGRSTEAIERVVRRHNRDAALLTAGHRVVGFADASGRAVAPPPVALAFCGLGNPGRFRRDLEHAGTRVVEFAAFRDHHPFTASELQRLRDRAAELGAALVTTEKDRTRLGLGGRTAGGPPLLVLRIAAEVHEPEALIERIALVIGKPVAESVAP